MKKLMIDDVDCEIPDHYDVAFFEQMFKDMVFRGNGFAAVNNSIRFATIVGDEVLAELFQVLKTYQYERARIVKKDTSRSWGEETVSHPDYKSLRSELRSIIKTKGYPSIVTAAIDELI